MFEICNIILCLKLLKSLLYSTEFPYTFEMQFCQHIFTRFYDHSDFDVLSKDDLKEYLIYSFGEFVKTFSYDNHKLFDGFWRSVKSLLKQF